MFNQNTVHAEKPGISSRSLSKRETNGFSASMSALGYVWLFAISKFIKLGKSYPSQVPKSCKESVPAIDRALALSEDGSAM